MCGIAGAFGSRESRALTERIAAALDHRGPDDSGFAALSGTGGAARGTFGHRRLAILDLTAAGHQPMWSPDGRYCLTCNGEIYNFRQLRDELAGEGIRVRSTGDTEVLLAGWARWGPAVLPRLRGMFAFALWDSEQERGYLVRDAFGIKPLYVNESGGAVLFASEVRALLASERIPRKLSAEALRSYLSTGSVAEPLTIIDSVRAVPPGCFVPIDCRRGGAILARAERFATSLTVSDGVESPETGGDVTQLRQILRDSVSHHLVSDVPVALFLSGGIDSSSVVALASEVSETRLDTFTVTFDEADYTEAGPARSTAKLFGTQHHEIPLSGSDLLDALPDAFGAMDQPSLDGLNTYVVSRAVRASGLKVVLSGLGGDELFGGYPSFRRARLVAPIWKLPRMARRMGAAGADLSRDPRLERISALLRGKSPAEAAYRASRTLFSDTHVQSLAGRTGYSTAIAPDDADLSRLSLLQQISLYELTGYMRNTLLRDSDVFSMAHGLELRVPFIDREVARAVMTFADSAKLNRGISKPILARAMHDILPEELLSRPKQGFTLPFERWMRQDLFREIDEVLASPAPRHVGLASSPTARVWSDFQERRPGMSWSRPWALYTLIRWAAHNGVAVGDESAFMLGQDDSLPLASAQ